MELENRDGVGSELVEWATVDRPTLLVIGSHGRGALGRMLMGSISFFVASNAPCPVLIARTDAVCKTLLPSAGAATSAMSGLLLGASPWARGATSPGACGGGGGGARGRVIVIAVDCSEEELAGSVRSSAVVPLLRCFASLASLACCSLNSCAVLPAFSLLHVVADNAS